MYYFLTPASVLTDRWIKGLRFFVPWAICDATKFIIQFWLSDFQITISVCSHCSANTSPSLNPLATKRISVRTRLSISAFTFFQLFRRYTYEFFHFVPTLTPANCFVLNWFFEGSITPTIGWLKQFSFYDVLSEKSIQSFICLLLLLW